jgi:hypothetical protein
MIGCVGENTEQRLQKLEETVVASGLTRSGGFF